MDDGIQQKPRPGPFRDGTRSSLTPERWQQIKEVFGLALGCEPDARGSVLLEACGGDESLRAEVESLLAAAEGSGSATYEVFHSVVSPSSLQPPPSETEDPMLDRRIGAYRLERRIGYGGMASVYLAARADDQYSKQVAIKLLRPELDNTELLKRFRNERQTMADLDHPNIVKLLDGGSTPEGLPFLIMDYVEGSPIDEYCDEHRLSVDDRLCLFRRVCYAAQYAHQHLVIHRDLKPSNILVTSDGIPKLLDFGIAKVLSPPDSAQPQAITQTLARRMTPAYASPEQIKGTPITTATDIYSLGVVLYELLTGRRPYNLKQSTPAELERAICEEEPENPSTTVDRVESTTTSYGTTVTITPDLVSRTRQSQPEKLRRRLRGDLDNIVLMALQKEPQRRYDSMEAFSEDIQRHLDHLPVTARRSTLAYRSTKFAKRHRSAVAAVAILMLVAFGGAVFARWEEKRAVEKARAEVGGGRVPGRRSVAVLSLKNLSGRPETSWVSTALAEMLTTDLAAGGGLRTIPGENVANMKSDLSLPETDTLSRETLTRVRKNLGSDYVILGSYLDLGGNGSQQVRLDVRLQDAVLGETIAAVAIDGVETNLSDLVVRAGTSLRDKLGVGPVPPAEAARVKAKQSSNPESLRLYAEGLAKLRTFDALAARDLLQKSVAADPSYALAHSGLAEAWSNLGYEIMARDEAKKAFELSGGLSREQILLVEARYSEAARHWDRAIEIYRTLFSFFPDELDYGLSLVSAQVAAGKGPESLTTVQALRRLPPILAEDPRVDLAEANVAGALSDYSWERSAASQAVRKGESRGVRLLVAEADLAEASSLSALGDLQGAKAASEKAREAFAATSDRFGEARALSRLGDILQKQGDYKSGMDFVTQSMAIQKGLGNREGELAVEGVIVSIFSAQGDLARAKATAMHRLAEARDLGRRTEEAQALCKISEIEEDQGDLAQAKTHIEEALAVSRQLEDPNLTAHALSQLGLLLIDNGDSTGGRRRLEESAELERRTGYKEGLAGDLLNLGDLSLHQFDLVVAEKQLSEALQILEEMGRLHGVASARSSLALLAFWRGDMNSARARLEGTLTILDRMAARLDAAAGRVLLASIAKEQGQTEDAEHFARQAAEDFRAANNRDFEVDADVELIDVLLSEGKLSEAQIVLESARKLAANTELLEVRFVFAIADGKVHAASGKLGDASKILDDALQQARSPANVEYEFEASLALAEVEIKSGHRAVAVQRLDALEKKARAKGVFYFADKAAAARKQKTTSLHVANSR